MLSNGVDRISIEGFKSIASIRDLELRPINLLVGANGAGKSNFIEVFSFLNAVQGTRLWEYVERAGGADRLLHFGSKTTKRIAFRLSFAGTNTEQVIDFEPTAGDQLFTPNWNLKLANAIDQIVSCRSS